LAIVLIVSRFRNENLSMNYFRYIIHECNYLLKQEEKRKGKKKKKEWTQHLRKIIVGLALRRSK